MAGRNRCHEAPWNEPVSRSASEPKPASKGRTRTARLSEELKPETRREETYESSEVVLRGARGQRAGKVGMGRLGDPSHLKGEGNEERSEEISSGLEARESERPIVAKRRGNARGAKGPWQKRSGLKELRS